MSDPIPPAAPAGIPAPETSAAESVSPAPIMGGLSRNIAAGFACLFSIVSGVVFLVIERRDKFVRFWAMQAVFLGGLAIAVAIVVGIAVPVLRYLPLIGGLLGFVLGLLHWLFGIAWVVAYFVCAVKAFSNEEWEIPVLGKLARQQLARLDASQSPPA